MEGIIDTQGLIFGILRYVITYILGDIETEPISNQGKQFSLPYFRPTEIRISCTETGQ